MCREAGADVEILNLYIGGCPLEKHAKNVVENNREYMVQYNGTDYGEERFATLDEGLRFREWDVVSIQQVSGLSGIYSSYQPHARILADAIRRQLPKARLVIHETWSYEHGSDHYAFPSYDCDPVKMYNRLHDAYIKLSEEVSAVGICPCGTVINALRATPEFDIREGGVSLHRDGFHLSDSYGRYTAGLCWLEFLGLGNAENLKLLPNMPEGEEINPNLIAAIKRAVKNAKINSI